MQQQHVEHNRMTSKWIQQRRFLEKQIARYEHGPRDRRAPFKNERMANLYRAELRALEAA